MRHLQRTVLMLTVMSAVVTACGSPASRPDLTDAGARAEPKTTPARSYPTLTSEPEDLTAPTGTTFDFDGTEWSLISLQGASVEDAQITLKFDSHNGITGAAPCTSYAASYSRSSNQFRVTERPPWKTNPDCNEPKSIARQVESYRDSLASVTEYRIRSERLEFTNTAGETILTFSLLKRPASLDSELQDTEWALVLMNGRKPVTGTSVTLEFRKGRISGSTGCNHYGGEYEAVEKGELRVREIAQTMMQCTGKIGRQEGAYLRAIYDSVAYRVTGDRLETLNAEGRTLLVFRRQ